jgi:hypothetical protein
LVATARVPARHTSLQLFKLRFHLAFALRHPALYEAVFILPTDLRFAEAETRPELRAAFESLATVVTPFCVDVAVVTEAFWAALHGLAELERSGRIRPSARAERITLVVRAIVLTGSNPPARGSCHSVE